jgi:predicted 2-oxoglutarate/Fe(II)-dependent dioxygenase YbiX
MGVDLAAPPPDVSKAVKFAFDNEILVVSTGLEWCQELIGVAESLDMWERATIVNSKTDAYQHTDRNNDVMTISGAIHPALDRFEKLLLGLVPQCAGLYKALNKHLSISTNTGFQILRYKPGQHFHEHVDNIAGHPTWGQRQLSTVLYLNDDYTGGEIQFSRQKKTVKPGAGDLVLFPSHFTHPHASLDVKEGTKFAVVSWFC